AALRHEDVRLLIIFFERRRAFGRTVVEIPYELSVLRKFKDAVLRRCSGDPHKTLPVDDNGLQRRGPERMISGASPRMNYISCRIEFNKLRSADAAVDPVVVTADLIRVRFRCAVQEPHMIV